MTRRVALLFLACLLACGGAACRQDMYNQPKYKPLAASEFFADGTAARPLPPHTVARGHLNEDTIFFTGKNDDGTLTASFPMPITGDLLKRGQERFNIYCSVCHGAEGDGNGMIVQRGFPPPNSYHIDRLRQAPPGYFYNVITNGYGVMYSYASRVEPADRWAIAAYIRALQLSRNARLDDVPANERAKLEAAPQPMTTLRSQFDRVQTGALIVGIVGLALAVLGAFIGDTRQFFFSYLFAFLFWMGLPLGSLCILMMHYLTGGSWGYPIRRFLEASIATLPLMAVLFVPFFFGLRHLYPWANPEVVAHDDALQKIHVYLNLPAYAARMIVCFGLWIGAATLLNRWSVQQDATTDPALTRRIRTFCGPGLLFFVLTVSLATVDWIMVLERNWYSTVFPPLLIIGQILLTFAFCAVMLAWVVGPAPFDRKANSISGVVRVEHFHTLGNFLLAFVMMWAYLTVSQLIIIWSGNEPREISWYLHRTAGAWRYVAIFLGLFNFGLPFCLLLSRENKKNVRFLTALAVGICVAHAVERYWQVMPSLHRVGMHVSWLDFAALAGIGGIWLAVFLARLKTHLTLPQNDPRMEPALVHGH